MAEKKNSTDNNDITEAIKACIPILEKIATHSELLAELPEPQRIALIKAAGKISRPSKTEIKKRNKDRKQQKRLAIIEKERRLRAKTGIRQAREDSVFTAPIQISGPGSEPATPAEELNSPRNCYVCKDEFTRLHHFYDTMCPGCSDLNYQKRFQTASLKGQVALITG